MAMNMLSTTHSYTDGWRILTQSKHLIIYQNTANKMLHKEISQCLKNLRHLINKSSVAIAKRHE